MDVDPQAVVDRLAGEIGRLVTQIATLQAVNEQLALRVVELEAAHREERQ